MRTVVALLVLAVAALAYFLWAVWRNDDETFAKKDATIASQAALLQRYRRWLISGEHPGDNEQPPAEPGAAG